jgi:hypothetical protein
VNYKAGNQNFRNAENRFAQSGFLLTGAAMSTSGRVKVGIIGSKFEADIHANPDPAAA